MSERGPRKIEGDSTDGPVEPTPQTARAADVAVYDRVDEWGEDSFPASDPPSSWSGP
jgi:hypothetical protein